MNGAYDTRQELEIIGRIRGEIISHKEHTGVNLFLVWGYPTVAVFLVEFFAMKLWNVFLCEWLWVGIPLVGVPLMSYYVKKDYDRTGRRTLEENLAMKLWFLIGAASALSGFMTGISGTYPVCYNFIQGLLIGMGAYLTGVISRFRPMKTGGIIACVLTFGSLFFQGDLWPWQLLVTVVVTVVAMIIPGHLSRYYVIKEKDI